MRRVPTNTIIFVWHLWSFVAPSNAFLPAKLTTQSIRDVRRSDTTCQLSSRHCDEDDGEKAMRCDSDIIIIGGGLVGAATGVALSRRVSSSSCTIYEQAGKLGRVGAAIGLYPNGLAALDYISPTICDRVKSQCSPCKVFERRDAISDKIVQTTNVPNINQTAPVMYAWFLLQDHLVEELPENCLHLGHTFQSYRVLENGMVEVSLWDQTLQREVIKTCRLLIGADGIHSKVRKQLLGGPPATSYYGKVMYRAVVHKNIVDDILDIPDGSQISWQGEEIGKSFSIRETTEGIVTVTAAALADPPNNTPTKSDQERTHKQRLRALFSEFSPTVHAIIDRLPDFLHEDFLRDIDIPTNWCDETESIVLLGDAVHAMTPGMGQGANQGLEDVCELVETLIQNKALSDFVHARLSRVTEIQERSAQNTRQSNTFTKDSASVPFQRRKYSKNFQDELYRWKPSGMEDLAIETRQ